MPENTRDISVPGTSSLSRSRDGRLHRRLELAVAAQSSILTGNESYVSQDCVEILAAMLASIVTWTTSSDVLEMALFDTLDICEARGVDMVQARAAVEAFRQNYRRIQKMPYAY